MEVLAACRDRIEQSEAAVRAWRTCDPDLARRGVEGMEAAERTELPLWGIPIGIKDMIDVAGMTTTGGSRVLAGTIADADAPVVSRLRAAGAVILGKTNTHEFAYGAVTPGTSNPWDLGRIPGGSSGGSAAALAAGHCLGALGTDTAGSIRIPAALCGVAGLKPRQQQVRTEGVIPLAPSFDVVGPMARTVEDVALLWEVLSGAPLELGGAGDLRVVCAPLDALPELEPEVASAYAGAVDAFRGMTASLRDADVPPFTSFDAPRSAVLMWEALEVHRSRGWWPDRAGDYTEETRGYLLHAEKNLSPGAVEAAWAECRRLAARLVSVFDDADVLVTPTVPCMAPTHEEAAQRSEGSPRRPIVMKLTRIPGPVNVAGLAALSVPCGLGAGGLPIGLQLIARDEETVLRLGCAHERGAGWAEPGATFTG
ncbi:MAG: aspartyl-tRNA(Asn)/glutamyl-tRNA(Gln) amidotransferase subunit [Actinomycetota bacterium]|nr:aspartyl-tRNA(Asn)/glutamyl-tRNA(Gln) amidotransferase subunit [Actinomycetota bacterium]